MPVQNAIRDSLPPNCLQLRQWIENVHHLTIEDISHMELGHWVEILYLDEPSLELTFNNTVGASTTPSDFFREAHMCIFVRLNGLSGNMIIRDEAGRLVNSPFVLDVELRPNIWVSSSEIQDLSQLPKNTRVGYGGPCMFYDDAVLSSNLCL